MTTELDEIRAILATTARQQAENTAAIAAMREQQAADNVALRQSITEGFEQTRKELQETDELSRQRLEEATADVVEMISNLGAQVGEVQQLANANAQAVSETRAIADSNARTAQALLQTIEDERSDREQASSELRVGMNLTANVVQGLITERREDWRQWREQQAEANQRFENLLRDARQDRQNNANQHQAALELIQTLFLEVQRLWREFRAG